MTSVHRSLDPRLVRVIEARVHDPQSFLGWHRDGHTWRLRVFDPHADELALETDRGWEELDRVDGSALFELERDAPARPVRLRGVSQGRTYERIDPYGFHTTIPDEDLWLFNAGRARQAYRALGAHAMTLDGVAGVRFAVWAPNAERVSVVGDFNRWDGRLTMMQSRGGSGVWEIFIPGLAAGDLYKFEIRNRHTGAILVKADPYARDAERRPGTASRVAPPSQHAWRDAEWLARRASWDWLHQPMSAYEVHTGSWRRHPDGREYSFEELAESLVPYVVEMGYTHIELLPITKHPLDESWGYQTTGYFAPTRRHGAPDGLRTFVDACHVAGIGVILDWVPGHFPLDAWALAHFDGTALYEHEDPRLGFHPDWGTANFNYGRNEVRSFLLSSAHYWLSEFHFDALRVDAVASMLYLDYSRREGEWLPNKYGGRENLEAIDFLRELNEMVHADFPGALTIAEESTAWPMVSRPTYVGGLGFSLKWNMGWMHDTLKYMSREPVYRRYHHDELTFGQLYAYSENFVLPFSHDEVVHGKGSLVAKMPGDEWQRHANARLLAVYQMTYPGKKINFMGNELAETREWSESVEIGWWLLQYPLHAGHQRLARDLNHLYAQRRALHDVDHSHEGFSWLDCHDADQSVLSYVRRARDGSFVVVVLNFTPVPREGYCVGVPALGWYREILNSDSQHYGGSDLGNGGGVAAEAAGHVGQPHSIAITVPPLAGLVFALD